MPSYNHRKCRLGLSASYLVEISAKHFQSCDGFTRNDIAFKSKSSPVFPEMHGLTLTKNSRFRAMQLDLRIDAHAMAIQNIC